MYKNNSLDNSKIIGCSTLQLSFNLAVKWYAFGYYSNIQRWLSLYSDSIQMNIS